MQPREDLLEYEQVHDVVMRKSGAGGGDGSKPRCLHECSEAKLGTVAEESSVQVPQVRCELVCARRGRKSSSPKQTIGKRADETSVCLDEIRWRMSSEACRCRRGTRS